MHSSLLLCTATRTENYTRFSSKVQQCTTGENVSDRRIVAFFRVEMLFFPTDSGEELPLNRQHLYKKSHGVTHQKFVISKPVSSLRIHKFLRNERNTDLAADPSDPTDLSRPLNSDLPLFWQFLCRIPPQAESP